MSLWLEIFKEMGSTKTGAWGDYFPLDRKSTIDFQQEIDLENILKDLHLKFGSPDAEALEYFVQYFIENNCCESIEQKIKEYSLLEASDREMERHFERVRESDKAKLLGIDIIERVFDWNNLPSLRNEFLMEFIKDGEDSPINGICLDDLVTKFEGCGIDIDISYDNNNIIDAKVRHYEKDYWRAEVEVKFKVNVDLRVIGEWKDIVHTEAEALVKRKVEGGDLPNMTNYDGVDFSLDALATSLKDFDCTELKIEATGYSSCET